MTRSVSATKDTFKVFYAPTELSSGPQARSSRPPASEELAVLPALFGHSSRAVLLGLTAAAIVMVLDGFHIESPLAAISTGLAVILGGQVLFRAKRSERETEEEFLRRSDLLSESSKKYARDDRGLGLTTPWVLPTDPASLQQLYRQVTSDSLTGLANSVHFASRLDEMVAQTNREPGRQISLALFSFDWPKSLPISLQDEYLKRLATQCRPIVRPGDMVCRLEDKLFGILLPNASPRAAMACADRIRLVLSAMPPLALGESPDSSPAPYFGVATLKAGESPDELRERAAQAMAMARTSPSGDVLFASNAPPLADL